MGWVIGIIFVIALIVTIIDEISKAGLWGPILFGIALLIVLCAWWNIHKKNQARELAKREAQKAQENRQLSLRNQSNELIASTKSVISKLPSDIDAGERALDDAEVEFQEGAFAPFWDAIERAINHLGYFDRNVQTIVNNSKIYIMLTADLEIDQHFLDLSINDMPDARNTSSRLQNIVRQAQKNFQFATIYEQRKTNQILVAGFGSLAEALNNMSYRIEESISCLSDTISVSFEKQGAILRDIRDQSQDIKVAIESNGKSRQEHYDRK